MSVPDNLCDGNGKCILIMQSQSSVQHDTRITQWANTPQVGTRQARKGASRVNSKAKQIVFQEDSFHPCVLDDIYILLIWHSKHGLEEHLIIRNTLIMFHDDQRTV